MLKKFLRNAKRGQAIVIIALMFVGLVAIIGLLTDGGMLLIEYARLKRGIDAAAIAAAQQFRKNFTQADLTNAAQEFLQLNQSDVFDVQTDTCLNRPGDPVLCTTPLRKLVRVTASRRVNFGFLRVIGINSTDITATSIGEAASIDMVLVIDTSASMAWETSGDPNQSNPGDDPSVCNLDNSCQPLKSVKAIARQFIAKMFFPYDRVAVVALTSQVPNGSRNPTLVWQLQSTGNGVTDQANVDTALAGLKVYEPPICNWGPPASPAKGACLNYGNPPGAFVGLDCPVYRYGADLIPNSGDEVYNPSSCPSSNVGGADLLAGIAFAGDPRTSPPAPPGAGTRKDSFWVVISLVGGPANASTPSSGDLAAHPDGYCPPSTWALPFCYDSDSATRHANGDPKYDAEDYARDMADFVADPVTGQGATMFTIGLGNLIRNSPSGDPAAAEKLLQYIALTAGGVTANHGNYFYAPDTTGLTTIFNDIYSKITTRISQ